MNHDLDTDPWAGSAMSFDAAQRAWDLSIAAERNARVVLGVAMAAARKAEKLSQRRLAELMGCSHVYVGDVENARRGPSNWFINRLREVLGDVTAVEEGLADAIEAIDQAPDEGEST